MTRRTFFVETTLYGKRLVTRAELYELHREVSRAASEARKDDPIYLAQYKAGQAAGRGLRGCA